MRRGAVGLVLLGIGAFFIVLAPLMRLQIAEKLIKASAGQHSITKLSADDARYFSIGDMKVLTGDLDVTVTTRGDTEQAEGDRVVWDQFTAVNDVTNNNHGISLSEFRSAFNRYSGEGITCCGVNVDKQPVQLQGQVFLFPFGTEKRTYPVFNTNTRRAFDAVFTGEDTINGLRVYKFEQKIPPTVVDTLEAPASALGMDQPGDVEVDRVYDAINTFWVEPTTGVPVKQQMQRHEVLKTKDGVERMPALIATLAFTPETVSERVDMAKDTMGQITLIKTTIPLVSLTLGIALAAAGLLLLRPARR